MNVYMYMFYVWLYGEIDLKYQIISTGQSVLNTLVLPIKETM